MPAIRESIPAADSYLRELGRATYNFAYLEWGIVWLTETLEPGFLSVAETLPAGGIAKRFAKAVERVPSSDVDRPELVELSKSFLDIVKERNRLIHGNPFTAEGGEQRLLYSGRHGRKDWTEQLIQQFSDVAATLGAEAGHLLHNGRYERWQHRSDRQF